MRGNDVLNRPGVLPDEWFERTDGVPMTKGSTRAAVMSLLNPMGGLNVLEIGSGTGAMTVELARAAERVTGVEISHPAAVQARRNVERAGLSGRVSIVEGSAPEDIPDTRYGAVFIGGHGKELERIIRRCFGLMAQGGRIILTSITPRTTSIALDCLGEIAGDAGFWRIHSSYGRRAGSDWLLIGNNPVDVIWGDK
ncbi:MAG: precorrin-6Y C5,15-methyltransferase (decarboxylating) subunit CbiT [Synergistaceae bacterium]|jgi:precorrin-6Y C5,15-methyltransferase (decarboxylating) CbiT subunit|nr:precorrin-6Y C5,15-methyltransferase (decarboxylating) subunit CbiT [Synergistaceae bacterium]